MRTLFKVYLYLSIMTFMLGCISLGVAHFYPIVKYISMGVFGMMMLVALIIITTFDMSLHNKYWFKTIDDLETMAKQCRELEQKLNQQVFTIGNHEAVKLWEAHLKQKENEQSNNRTTSKEV